MLDIAHQRCFHHPRREAVARCPGCGRFYCRECVTEHEGRVLCAACLAAIGVPGMKTADSRWLAVPTMFLICLSGVLLLWGFFYGLGRVVLSVPAPFHQGTVWTKQSWIGDK